MKKFGLCLASALMLALSVFGFSACGNVDTFEGQLSQESYATADAAAQAYLENEIDGNATETVFGAYGTRRDLTREEIEKLPLGDVKAEDVTKAEEGCITYYEKSSNNVSAKAVAADEDRVQKEQPVTLVLIENKYRYFVDAASNGEVITKTYFDSVMDYRNYLNCTIETESESRAEAQGQTQTVTMSYTIKMTADAVQMEVSMSGAGEKQSLAVYILPSSNGRMVGYTQVNGSWTSANMEYSSAEDIVKISMQQFIDHSYFEKTKSGFKLAGDKAMAFLYDSLNSTGIGSAVKGITFDSAEATYFVKEGKLSKSTSKVKASMSVSGVTGTVYASAKATYSKFGSTKVEIPASLTAYIGEN